MQDTTEAPADPPQEREERCGDPDLDMARQDTNQPNKRRRHQGRASCEVAGRRFEAEGPARYEALGELYVGQARHFNLPTGRME